MIFLRSVNHQIQAQRTPTHHDEVRQFHYSCGGQGRVTYHGDGGFTVAGTGAGDWSFGFLKEEKTVYYGSGSGQQGGNSASGSGGQNGGWNNRTLGQGAQQSLPYEQRQAISYGGGGGVVGQKAIEYQKRGNW
jgi:hypothetical protein